MITDNLDTNLNETQEADKEPLESWELLTENVMALVSQPSKVSVTQVIDGDLTRFTIHVAPSDIGKVIGKSGETVSILRKLFGRIAASKNEKIAIDVFDPRKSDTRAA